MKHNRPINTSTDFTGTYLLFNAFERKQYVSIRGKIEKKLSLLKQIFFLKNLKPADWCSYDVSVLSIRCYSVALAFSESTGRIKFLRGKRESNGTLAPVTDSVFAFSFLC